MPTEPPVAVVVGGGRGIGRAIALALGPVCAHVHVVARTGSEVVSTAAAIRARGGRATPIAADVSQLDQVSVLKRRVDELTAPPGVLVNAVGVYGPVATVADGDPRRWLEALRINVGGPYLTCHAFVGGMVAAGWGRIVNVSSAASLLPPAPLTSAYTASKSALNSFTRALAAELVGTGVTANLLHPGEVRTAMWRAIKEEAGRAGPAGGGLTEWARLVDETGGDPPEKAAEVVLRLLSDGAAGTSGQFLWIDAGLRAAPGQDETGRVPLLTAE